MPESANAIWAVWTARFKWDAMTSPGEVTASMSSPGLRCDRDDQTPGQLG
jgi:hypothetical protein